MKEALIQECSGQTADSSLKATLGAAYQEKKEFYITAKDYKQEKGIATLMHEGKDSSFYVKGPMGKGSNVSTKGMHVAFGAGTGVLVYLDIVARLIV